jgi:hypothetical protein
MSATDPRTFKNWVKREAEVLADQLFTYGAMGGIYRGVPTEILTKLDWSRPGMICIPAGMADRIQFILSALSAGRGRPLNISTSEAKRYLRQGKSKEQLVKSSHKKLAKIPIM